MIFRPDRPVVGSIRPTSRSGRECLAAGPQFVERFSRLAVEPRRLLSQHRSARGANGRDDENRGASEHHAGVADWPFTSHAAQRCSK